MSRELPRQYARPDGSILEVVDESQFRNDFATEGVSLWGTGIGYGTITVNMLTHSESYLAISHNKQAGFYIEAHIALPYRILSTQCPMTSSLTSQTASVWDGQTHFQVPLAFFVTPDQAAEIAVHFWLTGGLWEGVQWVDPVKFGWDLTSIRH